MDLKLGGSPRLIKKKILQPVVPPPKPYDRAIEIQQREADAAARQPTECPDDKQDIMARFLAGLSQAVKESPKCVALLQQNRFTDKLHRRLEKEQRERVAMAYAVHAEATAAGTIGDLVTAIKSADRTIKSKEARLVILNALIQYGKTGRQYASRDKSVMEWLEMKQQPYPDAAKFIKECGGLVRCAARCRDEKRGSASSEGRKSQSNSFASVCAQTLTQNNDCALLGISRRGGKHKSVVITETMKLPPTESEEETTQLWNLIREAISTFCREIAKAPPADISEHKSDVCKTNTALTIDSTEARHEQAD